MIQSRKGFNAQHISAHAMSKQEAVPNEQVKKPQQETPKKAKPSETKPSVSAAATHSPSSKTKEQLAFLLYVCGKETTRKYNTLLRGVGITYTQYLALFALWNKDNINVKTLGEQLYLDSGTLTPMLKKMEEAGFVKRTHANGDERNLIVSLTEKGKSLKDEIKQVEKTVFAKLPLSENEVNQLISSLGKMLKIF